MSDHVSVLVCAANAPWELPLMRTLARPEHGVRVLRRCIDGGELLGAALRDRPRAVLVDPAVGWLDRDLVASLHAAGVRIGAVGDAADRDLRGIGVRVLPADGSWDELVAWLHGLESEPTPSSGEEAAAAPTGRVVTCWGAGGSPGRTSVAVHVAIEAGRNGARVLLVDADVWGASVAQLLELAETPSVAQAARAVAEGHDDALARHVQRGPDGVDVLVGLPRAELWPEVREQAWRALLAAARADHDLVVVDVAAPVEADEDLVVDRIPYRRNVVTTVSLEVADDVVFVVNADPVGLRRAVLAHRGAALPASTLVLNRVPSRARRVQDCSSAVGTWTGLTPTAVLPAEPAFERVVWEGRPLHVVAPRSRWLRELQPVVASVVT